MLSFIWNSIKAVFVLVLAITAILSAGAIILLFVGVIAAILGGAGFIWLLAQTTL